MSNPQHCPVCGVKSTLKCSGCRNVVYCGKEHQKEHWRKGHKAQCKCFEIAKNEQLGRYLRSTRDIKKGEIILREYPALIGPKISTFPICLGCHKLLPISKQYYKCSKCTWPLCGPECETSKYHIDECELMAEKKFVCKLHFEGEQKKEAAYCVIAPLRGLLMKTKKPDVYKQFLELEDHLDDRINTKLYAVMKANLVTFVHTILGFTDLDERDILRIAAILDTNAFEIRHSQKKLRGIYLAAAMMSHDCIPNTRHVFDENMQILVIATTDIPKGGIITASYTQPLKSTLMRREHLWQAKCFNCCCKRCSDPTELGTFAGAIYCSKCKVGKIISTNPLDNQAVWKCQLCPHEIPARQITWGNAAMVKEIESLDKTNPRPFEEFIIRYQDTLHERNTHILQVKYALTQLYGNVEGFYLHELTDAGVARKIELCSELIEIADIFDPDWSQFRGILILDLQEILAVQAKREYNSEMLTKEATQEKLMEAMALLKEAVEILKVEPGMQTLLQERVASLAKEIEMD